MTTRKQLSINIQNQATKITLGAKQQAHAVQKNATYKVLDIKNGQEVLADDVLVQRKGTDLVMQFADGQELVLQGFYEAGLGATVELPALGTSGSNFILSAELKGIPVLSSAGDANASSLLYAHGASESLLQMALEQPALHTTLSQQFAGGQPVASWSAPAAAASGGGGLLGLMALGLAAAAGGGGGSSSSDTPVVKTPVINTLSTSWGTSLNATEDNTAGTITVATSNVENGQTVTISLGGANYTGTVNNNSATISISAPALQALSTGQSYTATASVSNAAGSAATPASVSFAVDTAAPAITSVTPSWGASLNATEDNTAGTITVATSGAENGQTVTVSLNGANYTGTVSNNSASISVGAAALQALANGSSYTLTANVSDAAGNPATANSATSFAVDTAAPTISAVTPSWGSALSVAEAAAGGTITVATSGVENGQTVTVSLNGANYTGTVSNNSASISVGAAALQALTAGQSYTLAANVADAAGNAAAAASSSFDVTYTAPTPVPAITAVTPSWGVSLNATEDNSAGTITVATSNVENGQTVTISLGGANYTGTVNNNSASISVGATALQALTNGQSYTATASVSNAAGSAATPASVSFAVDTAAPTISAVTPSWGSSLSTSEATAAGTITVTTSGVENGQSVTVRLNNVDYTGSVTNNSASMTVAASVLQALSQGASYTYTANVSDAAGNAATPASSSFTVDTPAAPAPVSTTTTVSGALFAGAITSGTDLTIQFYNADGTVLGSAVAVGNAGAFSATLSITSGGFYAKVINAAGNNDYYDEATATSKDITATLLAAGVANGSSVTLNITPVTTIAAINAGVSNTGTVAAALTTSNITTANTNAATAFGLDNILTTTPIVTTDATWAANQTTYAGKYGAVLATLSKIDADQGNQLTAMQSTIDGFTDGGGVNGYLKSSAETSLSNTGKTTLLTAATAINGTYAGITSVLTTVLQASSTGYTINTATFSADTGTAGDFITKTALQDISGTLSATLQAGQKVQVSLDNGSTWNDATTTVGANTWSRTNQTISGSSTLKVKVTDAANVDGTVYSHSYSLDNSNPDAVDLSADANTQATSSINVNATEASAGKSIASAIQAPSAADIAKIKIVLAGANLDATNGKDQLVLDAAKSLDADFSGTGATINSITGLDYSYTASTKTLLISKNGGGALTAADIDNVVSGILFKTASSTQGDRTATISYIDLADNEGTAATQTLTVDTGAPTLHASTVPATSNTGAGDSINDTNVLTVTFDGNVNGLTSGTASGIFKVAGNAVDATWGGSNASATRTLTYTVASGQNGLLTIDEAALKTALVAGITDAAGNAFAYTVGDGSIASIDSVALPTVDGSAPAIAATALSVATTDSSGSAKSADLKATDKVVLTIALGEAATGLAGLPSTTDSTVIKVNNVGVSAAWSTSGNNLLLTYTVGGSDSGAITIDEAALRTVLAAANITDTAGNTASVVATFNAVTDPTNVVDTTAPTLHASTVPATSSTGAGDSINDTNVLTVTFDGNVNGLTSGTASGIFKVAGNAVDATWSGSNASATRTLTYTVALGNNGLLTIDEDALKTALVASITDAAGNAFAYTGAIADIDSAPLPTVDGSAPAIAATALSVATTDSSGSAKSADLKATDKVVLTIALGEAATGLVSLPSTTDSTVIKVNGSGVSAAWSTSGSDLLLTYTVGGSDSGAITIDEAALRTVLAAANITDTAGNTASVAATFNAVTDPSNVVDTTAPIAGAFSFVDVDSSTNFTQNDTLTINFSEPVLATLAISDLALSNSHSFGTGAAIAAVGAANGRASQFTITLGATPSVAVGDALTVDNAVLGDAAGNVPASDLSFTVSQVDGTAPVFASAAVSGSTLVLTYTEANTLDAGNVPALGAFGLKVNNSAVGSNGSAFTGAAVVNANAKTVTLTLANAVLYGDTVQVSYTDPSANDDTNAIQDAAGNDASTVADQTVTNNTANVAPVNTVPAGPTVDEDTNLVFSSANSNAISVADTDHANLTVTLNATNGTMTLSGTTGLSFTTGDGTSDASMVFSGTKASINTALAGMAFRGNQDYNGAGGQVQIATSDSLLSDTDPIVITVTAVNDAPVLDATASPLLAAIAEDTAAASNGSTANSTLVSALVGLVGGGGIANVTEVDSGAFTGIAITGVNLGGGTLSYSTDGGTNWASVGAVTASSALLLAADASTRLHYQPVADYNGTLSDVLTFKAWDTTSGTAGNKVDTSSGTAFSSATDTVAITVTPQPYITNTGVLDVVTNLDVRSDIVLTFNEAVTAVNGGCISIVNDGGTGYQSESTVNTQNLYIKASTASTVSTVTTYTVYKEAAFTTASGTIAVDSSNHTVTLNPTYDLDLANNYHITMAAGSFTGASSSLSNAVFDGTSTMNFSTVTPGGVSGTSKLGGAAESVSMAADGGSSQVAHYWVGLDGAVMGANSPDGYQVINLDTSSLNYAMVLWNKSTATGELGLGMVSKTQRRSGIDRLNPA